jgi:membrane associated rhomboid family serine protease
MTDPPLMLAVRIQKKPAASGKGKAGSSRMTTDNGGFVRDDFCSPVYLLIATLALSFITTLPQAAKMLKFTPDLSLHLTSKGLLPSDWWQVLSSGFAFTSGQHLAETVFLVYIFGRVVERSHGVIGVWMFFLSAVIGR